MVKFALNYAIAGFTANYAYNTGDVDYALRGSQTADSHVVSATYSSLCAEGLYLAGVYAMNNYMNSAKVGSASIVLEETVAIELLASYALSNSIA
ncbi:hypothetical protein OH492_16095 [Vibrio chagasii]|nr:hypothetical protein [Vibrio chagasii]